LTRSGEVHLGAADEAGDEYVGRLVVELLRWGTLLDAAILHDRHPVAHRHRLGLVMRDVESDDAGLML
jgi:hypothetical protein